MNRMKSTDEVIGINCFDEFLSFGDFLVYTQTVFPNKEFSYLIQNDLIFYSKRLNLFVNRGCKVHYLND
jgi:hypothetical protein